VIHRNPQGRAVLDGEVVPAASLLLPWSDPSAQWGLGVFETMAVFDAAPRHRDDHLERLSAAARRLGIELPPASELVRATDLVAEGCDRDAAWLKIAVSRSGRWAVFAGALEPDEAGRPVSVVVLRWRRHRLDPTVGIKSMNYAACLVGLEEARRRGADEGLWLNERGHLIGACTGNLFAIRGRAAITPALSDGARDGVTRARAILGLRELGFSLRQSKCRLANLKAADEILLTASLSGVRPVVRVDGRDVRRGEPGPVSRRLALLLSDREAAHGAANRNGRQGA